MVSRIYKSLVSVSSKILFLTCSFTILTALVIGTLYYKKVENVILQRELDKLAFEARSMEPQFRSAFEMLRNHVTVLSSLPPIQGLVRSTQSNGIDPLDGSTTQIWRERLETIFVSLIKTYPQYVQIRYIGVADNGRELVRVNRNGEIKIVAPENLQQKDQESYFTIAKALSPGRVYFSPVNLNREHGKVQVPHLPVIRAVTPVYDNNNELFGMIVINAAYDRLISEVIQHISPERNVLIVNENGDSLTYKKEDESLSFNLKEMNSTTPADSLILSIIKEQKESGVFFEKINNVEHIVNYHKLFFDPLNSERFLGFILNVPRQDLIKDARTIRLYSFLLGGGLIIFSFISAFFIANTLRSPLKAMIKEMQAYGQKKKTLKLPVDRHDEIGELAKNFKNLTDKLERSMQTERQALEKLEATVNTVIDGIVTINSRGIVRNFNPSAERIFGYKAEEVIGQNIKMLMPEPYHSEHDQYLKNYLGTGDKKIIGIGREVEGKRKNGSVFPMGLGVNEMFIKGEKMFVGSIRDISARKKAEAEIMRSNAELERFAYLASHDLQEPLRMVTNFTALLEEEYGTDMDEQATEYMGFIISASKRMQSLVSDLLEYSRAGSENAGFSDFNCQAQLDIALDNLKDPIDETGAKVTADPMPEIYANPVRFSSLLQNLIGNALKYRDKDRTPKIHVGVQDKEKEWLFSVRDNGIGINENYKDQVFVIFKRLHNKGEYSGTGIGLSICKKIVETLGGQIWVESEEGKGSTFFFTVPKKDQVKKAA